MQLNQALLKHAAEKTGLTYIEIDFENGVVITAENFSTVMGYEPSREEAFHVEADYRVLLDHVASRDQARVEDALKQLMTDASVSKIQYAVFGDDQLERFIESVWSIEMNAEGKPLKIFAANLNVTERKQADNALRSNEEFSRTVIESSSDCVKTLDGLGRIVSLNRRGLCLMEIEDFASLQGKNWWELWPEASHSLLRDAVAKAQRGEVARFEAFCPTVKGTPKWWDVLVAPVLNGEGPIERILAVSRDITSNKKSEENERENNARLSHASIETGLTYVEVDLENGQLRTGSNFAEVMGFHVPSQESLNNAEGKQALLRHVVPQDRSRVEIALQEFLTGTSVGKIEYRVLGDDNLERCIDSIWSVESGANGKPLKAFATNFNITERKRVEDELTESEERYRNLFNSIDEGFCVIEMISDENSSLLDYRYLEVNPSFEKQTGLKDAVGKTIREISPNIENHWLEVYGKVAKTGAPMRFVDEAKSLEGRWFDVYAFKIGGDESRKVAVLFRNVTEQKRYEEALRASLEQFRSLAEAIPQFIWTANSQGELDYVNPQWTEYTGSTLEQTVAHMNEGVCHSEDAPRMYEKWLDARKDSVAFTCEVRIRRAQDGAYRWFLIHGTPQLDETGKVLRWFGVTTDIDEQKRTQLEIVDLNVRLQRAIAEGNHRIKNNLQVLSALIDVQTIGAILTTPISAMERLQQHIRTLASLHDLLTLDSRVGDGVIESISLKIALERLIGMLQTASGGRNIVLKQVEDAQLPIKQGGTFMLLVNEIVQNAVKHGGGEVQIDVTNNNGMVRLEICDDGVGFPSDFDPKTAANTGLDLIESLGRWDLRGDILYENRAEGGAKVVVTFPLPADPESSE